MEFAFSVDLVFLLVRVSAGGRRAAPHGRSIGRTVGRGRGFGAGLNGVIPMAMSLRDGWLRAFDGACLWAWSQAKWKQFASTGLGFHILGLGYDILGLGFHVLGLGYAKEVDPCTRRLKAFGAPLLERILAEICVFVYNKTNRDKAGVLMMKSSI